MVFETSQFFCCSILQYWIKLKVLLVTFLNLEHNIKVCSFHYTSVIYFTFFESIKIIFSTEYFLSKYMLLLSLVHCLSDQLCKVNMFPLCRLIHVLGLLILNHRQLSPSLQSSNINMNKFFLVSSSHLHWHFARPDSKYKSFQQSRK